MNATIGRIVHFVLASGYVRPAIITAVHSGDAVGLTVFTSQDDVGEAWPFTGRRTALRADEPTRGCWHWPDTSGAGQVTFVGNESTIEIIERPKDGPLATSAADTESGSTQPGLQETSSEPSSSSESESMSIGSSTSSEPWIEDRDRVDAVLEEANETTEPVAATNDDIKTELAGDVDRAFNE